MPVLSFEKQTGGFGVGKLDECIKVVGITCVMTLIYESGDL